MDIQRPVQIDPALRVLRNRPHEVAEPAHLAFEVQPGVADTPLAPVQREPDRLCRIVRSPRQCPQVEVIAHDHVGAVLHPAGQLPRAGLPPVAAVPFPERLPVQGETHGWLAVLRRMLHARVAYAITYA